MKKLVKIFSSFLFIVIAVFTIWFAKNWMEAGQRIMTSENYSKLNEIRASGKASENQKLIFEMKSWTKESFWPCSGFHLQKHVSHAIEKDFMSDWDHKKPMIEWHKSRAFLSCRLEHDFSPAQLRSYFFENVFIGNREYGVEKISQRLFAKPFEQLTKREVIQVGIIITNPSRYHDNKKNLDERTAYWLEKLEDK